jgi:hypothetical protein
MSFQCLCYGCFMFVLSMFMFSNVRVFNVLVSPYFEEELGRRVGATLLSEPIEAWFLIGLEKSELTSRNRRGDRVS